MRPTPVQFGRVQAPVTIDQIMSPWCTVGPDHMSQEEPIQIDRLKAIALGPKRQQEARSDRMWPLLLRVTRGERGELGRLPPSGPERRESERSHSSRASSSLRRSCRVCEFSRVALERLLQAERSSLTNFSCELDSEPGAMCEFGSTTIRAATPQVVDAAIRVLEILLQSAPVT